MAHAMHVKHAARLVAREEEFTSVGRRSANLEVASGRRIRHELDLDALVASVADGSGHYPTPHGAAWQDMLPWRQMKGSTESGSR